MIKSAEIELYFLYTSYKIYVYYVIFGTNRRQVRNFDV